jgi:hypothetical protein
MISRYRKPAEENAEGRKGRKDSEPAAVSKSILMSRSGLSEMNSVRLGQQSRFIRRQKRSVLVFVSKTAEKTNRRATYTSGPPE